MERPDGLFYKDIKDVTDSLKSNAQDIVSELEEHGKTERFTKLCYQQLMNGLWLQTDPTFQQ